MLADVVAGGGEPYADGCRRSTTAGSRSACGSSRTACRSCARGRRRCTTRWTSASTTGPSATGSSSTTTPSTGDEAACCYDTIVSESRIASYVGIEKGELPPRHYYGAFRGLPRQLRRMPRRSRSARTRTYLGERVFEGALPYAGMRVTPSWGGSMFEALMPSLFVPEERWGPGSWGMNHPLSVRAQIHHGLTEAGYGYWGFSPANNPEGGYDVYGVDGIGMDADGNASNEDKTLIDHGYAGLPRTGLRCPTRRQSAYTNGVVTPHASFLALRYAPREALANLRRLERDFPGLYGKWGFRDSGQRRHRHVVVSGLLPLARPGHGHGRARQRARRRRAAPRVRRRATRASAAAAAGRRGVRRDAARVHDHRYRAGRSAARHARRRRHLRPRRRRPRSTAPAATTRSSATRAATASTAATGRRHAVRRRRRRHAGRRRRRRRAGRRPGQRTGCTAAAGRTSRTRVRGSQHAAPGVVARVGRAPRSGGRRTSAARPA